MKKSIDLNCDMGESYGVYKIGLDEDVIKLITSVNIACGFHGGDPDVMDSTVAMAKNYGVGIGAHPGFPNLLGFGRWDMDIPSESLTNLIMYQIGSLNAFCQKHDVEMQHVKPHGNLNNMADFDTRIALSIVKAVKYINPKLPIYVKPNSELERISREKGVPVITEIFADRAYNNDMSLVARTHDNAVILDPNEAAERVAKMVLEKKVTTITGDNVVIEGETICVHGDTPDALMMIQTIRDKFEEKGIPISSPF